MRTIIRDNYTPEPGDYHDMYVFDEAQGKSWRFDCDGVFYETTIENEYGDSTTTAASQYLVTHVADGIDEKIAEEAAIREAADEQLQEEIDDLKNSPDVVDIVATYADLQAYDTSKLGDKDVVRVLTDETHDNESSYYRWDKTNNQWVFIGAVEGYYTRAQTDDLLDEKQDTLTAGSNIQISGSTISATDTTYTAGNGLDLTGTTFSADTTVLATQADLATKQDTLTAGANISIDSNNVISATDTTYSDFTGTDGTTAGAAGLVPAPATTDAGKFLKADGTWDTAGGGGPTVVQTTGTSTTDVMSQKATTSMVFADPSTVRQVRIGNTSSNLVDGSIVIGRNAINYLNNASGSAGPTITIGNSAMTYSAKTIAIGKSAVAGYSASNIEGAIAIGNSSQAGYGGSSGTNSIAIGTSAKASTGQGGGYGGIAIGASAQADNRSSIALGAYSKTSATGEMNIGSTSTSYGYNSSNYRLLTGVYDGQSAHDAATYGQVISYSAINGAGAPTTATEGKYVGQLYYDTTNEAMYFLKTIDTTTTPATYTWEALGGGSSVNVVQTTGTSTTDVMSQNATTNMVFADPGTLSRIKIGAGDSNNLPGVTLFGDIYPNANGIAIGMSKSLRSSVGGNGRARDGVAIGGTVGAGDYSVAVGYNASTWVSGTTAGSNVPAYNSSFGYSASNRGKYGTAIGASSIAGAASSGGDSQYNTAVGYSAKASANNGISTRNGTTAVGALAWASANYSAALGSYSKATEKGQMDISTLATTNTYGYNNSQYRLLTGLYDPQSDHDAATKGYVDTAVSGAGGASLTNTEFNTIFGTNLTEGA